MESRESRYEEAKQMVIEQRIELRNEAVRSGHTSCSVTRASFAYESHTSVE
jgi:hypothetical protein